MAVTDLTGTTWVLNQNGVDVSTLYTWNVNYDVTGTFAGSYTVLAIVWNTRIPEEEVTLSGSTSGLAPFAGESWSYEGTFTFTGGTDATNATLIAWLQANAVQQGGSDGVTITYDGETISTITQDGTTTLPTNGKCMATDVVVSGNNVSSATITYNGNTIATGTGTFTKTLQCAGKVMATDVTIAVVISSIIYTFENGELTISNAPYEFSGGELTI